MPTPSDLVTDLPADFETFGQAVDTSLADLKGGTTGQVLSKASNTDMDFNWVAADDTNAIQNTIVDAKGDLISATGSDVPARLAVGANGETLVADSSTSTGLRYQGLMAAGKNAVINGGMDIWQRGTSFASSYGGYSADRWSMFGDTPVTYSRQTTSDTTNLPFIQYALRQQRTSGSTVASTWYLGYSSESVNSVPYAGKTIAFSFYARAGANYSATSNVLRAIVTSGTGTDQNAVSPGFTGSVTVIDQNATLTTTWQRFTYTGTMPTNSNQFGIQFLSARTGTAGANDWYEVTGVQFEVGSVATQFSRAGGNIQGELAACQRYYYRANFDGSAAYPYFGQGGGYTSTVARLMMPFPVAMRRQPTAIDTSAMSTFRLQTFDESPSITPTGIGFNSNFSFNQSGVIDVTVASGLTAEVLYLLRGENTTTANIGWSAEL